MPEGDTIAKLAERIQHRFGGATVQRSRTRDPRLVGVSFSDSTLLEATASGKHLLLRFDDGRTLHSHLMMDGRWEVGRVARVPEWQRRVELWFPDGRLTAVDVPQLGVVATADEAEVVGHLGPDLCGTEPVAVDLVAERMRAEGDRELAAVMLDQRVVAGWGNVFAVEVPFIAGISPYAPVGQIEGLDELARIGSALLRWSAAGNPRNTTGRRLRIADHFIYQAAHCPVCGARVETVTADASPWRRAGWRCPGCQPADAATVDTRRIQRLLALHPALRTG